MSEGPEKIGVDGAQRVAAFLLSLDKEGAANVMRHLDPEVLADVAQAMTDLSPELCTEEAVQELFGELARTVYRAGVRPQEDFELRDILEHTFGPEEAERVVREIYERRRNDQPFAVVESQRSDVVARVLAAESPAVVSLILSHISPSMSAEVLAVFDEAQALDIIKRMTAIRPPRIETMLAIADDIGQRLEHESSLPSQPDSDESLKTVADLLNHAKSDIEKAVLEGIEEESEEVAGQIREFMFTWEDLASIEKRTMQKILSTVDTRTLSMSLKACSDEVVANVMGNLSVRVREMVKDERDLLGAVPMTEVLMARNEIMMAVRGLMDSGEIAPAHSGEELVT